MAVFKGVYFFSQFKQGWTETYFKEGASLAEVQIPFVKLGNYITLMRAVQTTCDAVRMTLDQPPGSRVSKLVPIGIPGSRVPGGGTEAEDIVGASELVRIGAVDGSSQPHMIRGLLDTDVVRRSTDGLAQPSGQLVTANNFFFSALQTLQFAVRRYDRTQPRIFVTAVGATTVPGFTSIGVSAGHPFTIGMTVRFNGVPLTKLPWLKGLWTVVGVGPTYFNIGFNYPLAAPLTPSQMYAIPVVYTYPLIASLDFLDFRTRKTGRPTAVSRGRSRGVPFRRSSRAGV